MMVSQRNMIVLGVLLGLLLLVIGNIGGGHRNVTLAGDFIFAMTLFWGGLASEENLPVKIALLAIGGLFVLAVFAGSPISLASLLGR
jgi:hypothetical protein